MILLLIQEQNLSKHLSLDIVKDSKPFIKIDFAIHGQMAKLRVYVSHITWMGAYPWCLPVPYIAYFEPIPYPQVQVYYAMCTDMLRCVPTDYASIEPKMSMNV